MSDAYPTPRQLGLPIPVDVNEERFNAGFAHALDGGHLDSPEYFRYSFRLGFRAAKCYLRRVRRSRGIVDFPMAGRIKVRALWR